MDGVVGAMAWVMLDCRADGAMTVLNNGVSGAVIDEVERVSEFGWTEDREGLTAEDGVQDDKEEEPESDKSTTSEE